MRQKRLLHSFGLEIKQDALSNIIERFEQRTQIQLRQLYHHIKFFERRAKVKERLK